MAKLTIKYERGNEPWVGHFYREAKISLPFPTEEAATQALELCEEYHIVRLCAVVLEIKTDADIENEARSGE